MVPEKKINGFVRRLRAAAGANLESVILFGSAVVGDFHPEFSNLNLFCVIRDSSFAALQALAPAVKWWAAQKQPPPLFMTRDEIARCTDVFTIELVDMQRHHRIVSAQTSCGACRFRQTCNAPRWNTSCGKNSRCCANTCSLPRAATRVCGSCCYDRSRRSPRSFATR